MSITTDDSSAQVENFAKGQRKGFAAGRTQELDRHLATARKLLESGMSRELVKLLTSFSSRRMAKIVE